MSRIGKHPVSIPAGVTVTIAPDSVTVKGPKGELTQHIKEVTVRKATRLSFSVLSTTTSSLTVSTAPTAPS